MRNMFKIHFDMIFVDDKKLLVILLPCAGAVLLIGLGAYVYKKKRKLRSRAEPDGTTGMSPAGYGIPQPLNDGRKKEKTGVVV